MNVEIIIIIWFTWISLNIMPKTNTTQKFWSCTFVIFCFLRLTLRNGAHGSVRQLASSYFSNITYIDITELHDKSCDVAVFCQQQDKVNWYLHSSLLVQVLPLYQCLFHSYTSLPYLFIFHVANFYLDPQFCSYTLFPQTSLFIFSEWLNHYHHHPFM